MTVRAYIGLGSNLADPIAQIQAALIALDQIPGTHCVRHSSLYRSAPLGSKDQPAYVNAVAALDTGLAALELLAELQAIEQRQGRVRGAERWGPRTLDLDLLLYGDTRCESEILSLPHPRLHERSFVLYPLYEIAPDIEVPGQGSVRELAERCCKQDTLSCERLT